LKLSILIPTLESRAYELAYLLNTLNLQILEANAFDKVEIKMVADKGEVSIGAKRNELLRMANGEYVCFIDDDDKVENYYIKTILNALESKPDCLSLRGVITWDNTNPEIFEHSVRYNEYKTNHTGEVKYERFPNHLNVIKKDIATQFKFPEINHGEDTDWATQINKSGLLKNEFYIDKTLYHYQYKPSK
jgi:hypothetical protein